MVSQPMTYLYVVLNLKRFVILSYIVFCKYQFLASLFKLLCKTRNVANKL